MGKNLDKKSTVDQIRRRFDKEVERFSNLETGQQAAVDAPLMMELTAEAALAAAPGAKRMLDVGCGAGNYTLKILETKADINCDLVDLSAPMLARAYQRVRSATRGEVQTFQTDIRRFEPSHGCYDIIVAAAVFHHLRDKEEWYDVFEKLYASCAHGGSVWIVDLVCHESPAVQQIMDARYGRYLENIGGAEYRTNVMATIDMEDSPRPLQFQLELLLQVGFTSTEVLHKNTCYAAFGAFKKE